MESQVNSSGKGRKAASKCSDISPVRTSRHTSFCSTQGPHRRPEVLERQRLRMAEKRYPTPRVQKHKPFSSFQATRAATKARRRQWDPPKKVKPAAIEECACPAHPSLPPSPTLAPLDPHTMREGVHHSAVSQIRSQKSQSSVVSLTFAERFAMGVLLEMAGARTAEDSQSEHVAALAMQYGYASHFHFFDNDEFFFDPVYVK